MKVFVVVLLLSIALCASEADNKATAKTEETPKPEIVVNEEKDKEVNNASHVASETPKKEIKKPHVASETVKKETEKPLEPSAVAKV